MLWSRPIAIRPTEAMFEYYDGPTFPNRISSTLKDLILRSFHINFDKVDVILLINNTIKEIGRNRNRAICFIWTIIPSLEQSAIAWIRDDMIE